MTDQTPAAGQAPAPARVPMRTVADFHAAAAAGSRWLVHDALRPERGSIRATVTGVKAHGFTWSGTTATGEALRDVLQYWPADDGAGCRVHADTVELMAYDGGPFAAPLTRVRMTYTRDDAPAGVPACERCGVALIPDWPGWVHSPALASGLHLPEPNAAARALGDGRTGEVPPADPAAGYTCETCGGALTRDWGGWMHARKPGRVHRVRPNAAARTADAARVMRDTAAAAIVPADPWADLLAALEPSPS